MSELEKLIEKLCPNGVEYKLLKECCYFQNGFAFKSSLFKNVGEKILRITNITDGSITDVNCVYFNPDDYSEDLSLYKVNKGDIVVAMSGATTGKIGYNYSCNTYFLNQRVGLFKPNEQILNKRYLYHWLLLKSNDILNMSSGTGAQPNLSSTKMMNSIIPLPPLEVQNEIVRILDKFTELTAELTTELTARRKQYEYYRNKLLKNNSLEKVKLGDYLIKVNNINWKQCNENHFYIDLNSVDREKHKIMETTRINKANAPSRAQQKIITNDVLFGTTRPMLKRSCLVSGEYDNEICSTGFCVLRANQNYILPKWIYYIISTDEFYNYVEKNQKGASYPAISDIAVKNYTINLPPLKEQQKIVDILDRFDKLCNDISEGLPAEIDARKKQYEYYRDKLLNFKELSLSE